MRAGRAGHRKERRFSRGQVHRCPDGTPISLGVAWFQAKNEEATRPAGAQHPLGHVHGKLVHGLDLGVGFAAVQDEPDVGGPAVWSGF